MRQPRDQKWLPVVLEDRCTGCGRCVEACTPACLEILNEAAVLTRPNRCGSEEHCIPMCHTRAIRMCWMPMRGDVAVGLWRDGAPARTA